METAKCVGQNEQGNAKETDGHPKEVDPLVTGGQKHPREEHHRGNGRAVEQLIYKV